MESSGSHLFVSFIDKCIHCYIWSMYLFKSNLDVKLILSSSASSSSLSILKCVIFKQFVFIISYCNDWYGNRPFSKLHAMLFGYPFFKKNFTADFLILLHWNTGFQFFPLIFDICYQIVRFS